MQLSGEVRRKIGLKTLELGANAVIGYKQFFDLEGESGIVVRVSVLSAYLKIRNVPTTENETLFNVYMKKVHPKNLIIPI